MKRLTNYTITKTENKEQLESIGDNNNYYYLPDIITFKLPKKKELKIVAIHGKNDNITFFSEDKFIYYLTVNDRLGYIGLIRINIENYNPMYFQDEIFLQTDFEIKDIEEMAGIKDIFNISERKQINILSEYLSY